MPSRILANKLMTLESHSLIQPAWNMAKAILIAPQQKNNVGHLIRVLIPATEQTVPNRKHRILKPK
jgi:hypothetical protein